MFSHGLTVGVDSQQGSALKDSSDFSLSPLLSSSSRTISIHKKNNKILTRIQCKKTLKESTHCVVKHESSPQFHFSGFSRLNYEAMQMNTLTRYEEAQKEETKNQQPYILLCHFSLLRFVSFRTYIYNFYCNIIITQLKDLRFRSKFCLGILCQNQIYDVDFCVVFC